VHTFDEARRKLDHQKASMTSYARFEWVRAQKEAWLIRQAYAGMLLAMEQNRASMHAALVGKLAIAELAESAIQRICCILGGSAYSRGSPFGFWQQDVRALGYLRPPWTLAYDQLANETWPEECS
jgi:hypothetical protein